MARDMTDTQFKAALKRNGFAHTYGGCWYTHKDFPHIHFGAVVGAKGIFRRATIAKLLSDVKRQHEKERWLADQVTQPK
jgi:hypothetical protein